MPTPRGCLNGCTMEFGRTVATHADRVKQQEMLSLKWPAHQEMEGLAKWLVQKLADDSRQVLCELQQKHVASVKEFLAVATPHIDPSSAATPGSRSGDPPLLGVAPTTSGVPDVTNLAAEVNQELQKISARLDQQLDLLKNATPRLQEIPEYGHLAMPVSSMPPVANVASADVLRGNAISVDLESKVSITPRSSRKKKDEGLDTSQNSMTNEAKCRNNSQVETKLSHSGSAGSSAVGKAVTGSSSFLSDDIESGLDSLIAGEEKEDHDRWQQIVHSTSFTLFFGGAIILNTILMSIEMQYLGDGAAVKIEWPDAQEPAGWIGDTLTIADKVFLWLFTAELVIKMICLRRKFLKDWWNWLDFLIVGFGLVENFVQVDVGLDPMMLRLLRLVKLVRFLKMFKMAGNLFVLNLIMKAVINSISTLAWSMLLLFMLQAVAGIFIGQLVYGYLTDPDNDPSIQRAIFRYYGTFTRTMFTMFEITFVSYVPPARVLTDNVNEHWAWFFILYRCFVSFAVLQVIRAVFIQQTLKVAEHDKELLLMSNARNKRNFMKKLTGVFDLMDAHHSGKVPHKRFVKILAIPKVQEWMGAMGVDPSDPEKLFTMMDRDGNDAVSLNEFVTGCSKVQGPARSIDLFNMFDLCNLTMEKLDLLMPEIAKGREPKGLKRKSVLAADNGIGDDLRFSVMSSGAAIAAAC